MAFLFMVYLLIVIALPLTLGLVVSYRSLPRDGRCPRCAGETLALRSGPLRALAPVLPAGSLTRRWCAPCGWHGFARVGFTPRLERVVTRPGAAPRSGCRTEPLRRLQVGNTSWRVLLQCWQRDGVHFGRLLYVGPGGRLWLDEREPITGATRVDVFTRASALSDGLLTYRLREIASD